MPNSPSQNVSQHDQIHHDPQFMPEGDSLKNGPSEWKGKKGKKKDGIKPGSAEDILRSMPVDADAERAVLSCMLKDPTNIIPKAENVLKSAEFFYVPAHKIIFETIIGLYRTQQGGHLDIILLNSELQDKEMMDRVGGPKFVADLVDDVPTTAMFDPYVEVLKKKFILRRVISDCTKCVSEAYEHPEDAAVFLDGVEKSVLKIRDETENQSEIKDMKTSVMNVVQELEQIMNGGVSLGLMSGFKDIDKMTNGMHGGEMIVVAARPAMGKTSFVMNIVENISICENPTPSAIFSLEMTAESLVQRLICSRAKVHMSKMRGGFLSKQDFPKLMKVAGEMAEAPIWIDDTPGLSINELRAKARRLKQQHNIGFIAIDYLQLLKAPDVAAQGGREKEVAEISGGIKGIAKELSIPIIVLAQLNRNPDGRGGKPKMSDLRESGSIEQDADLVGLLMREEYYAEDQDQRDELAGTAEFIIAKQRNGGTGEIPLTFEKEFMRFGNAALDHHNE